MTELEFFMEEWPWAVTGHTPFTYHEANLQAFRMPLERIQASAKPYELKASSDRSGVYFLFEGSRLMYVGKAEVIWYRLAQHRGNCMIPFTHVAFIETPTLELPRLVEDFYIAREQPPCNIKGIRRAPSVA